MIDLVPGDFASVPPGIAHTSENIRKDQPPVKVCNLMTPGGLDGFFVAVNELGPAGENPEKFAMAAEKFGTSIVGPPIRDKLGLVK